MCGGTSQCHTSAELGDCHTACSPQQAAATAQTLNDVFLAIHRENLTPDAAARILVARFASSRFVRFDGNKSRVELRDCAQRLLGTWEVPPRVLPHIRTGLARA